MADGVVQILVDLIEGNTDKALESIKGKVASTAKTLVSLAAMKELAEGVKDLTSASVQAYGRYEQLVGGVDTLYKDSSSKLQAYAAEAYKTSGMSANAYMEQATSFAGSLVQALGGDTAKAADYANTAITDMSDNANKMGTDIGRITDAYQGFAKQNYTMLDNLKLGYGGTKTEMERLLADAEKLTGIHYDIDSFADIVDAIHAVQVEMGIAGTTAEEAASTIEGSIGMVKASWENLLVAMADYDADLEASMAQLMDSVAIAAGNLLPRIGQVVSSMGEIFAASLPKMRTALYELFAYIESVIVSSLESISAALPQVIEGLLGLLLTLGQRILELVPAILPSVFQAGVSLFMGLVNAVPTVVSGLVNAVNGLINAVVQLLPTFIPQVLEAALLLFTSIVDAVPQIIPTLTAGAMNAIYAVVDLLPTLIPLLLDAAVTLFLAIVDSLPIIIPQLINAVLAAINRVSSYLPTLIPKILSAAKTLFMGIAQAVPQVVGAVLSAVGSLVSQIPGTIRSFIGTMIQAGKDLIAGLASGITAKAADVASAAVGAANAAVSKVKSALGIHSPSKVFMEIGGFTAEGMALGIKGKTDVVTDALSDMTAGLASLVPQHAYAYAGSTTTVTYSFGDVNLNAADMNGMSGIEAFLEMLETV